ncbi:hypothetical protein ACO2RV_01725 [Ancylobacter sp. VNQ12]|uniref:hypothetical protein n=1 Tax=Ancylobacter sp. VNQ12 TaxID=3400920 RepID=UPI003BFBBD4A
MFRILLAAALIATFGITGASAAGRSKDERAAWWQTMRESKAAMQMHRQKHVGAAQSKAAPLTAKPAPAVKPAQ